MSREVLKRIVPFVLACSLALAAGSSDAASGEATAAAISPELEGFSAERLNRLTSAMHAFIDAKELSGMVTLIARHGKLVYADAYGVQDMVSKKPMTQETIFRIYSMTKPVTGVAMMILYEEGKWLPDDPLAKYIPEFANLKVFAGVDAQGQPILEAPVHPPTVGELLTHTAGFTYGIFGDTPLDKMVRDANPLGSGSLKEMIGKLSKLPLAYQPGTKWQYSLSVDIQGYLIEKLSGKSLPDFMRERIFVPLGMKDTAFNVPEQKLPRLASEYAGAMKSGALDQIPRAEHVTKVPGLASGGGGLYSTAGDYLRFAQMLLNGGTLDGARILAPATVELMRSNHLAPHLQTGEFGIGLQRMRPGFGFGYDVAVFEDPAKAGSVVGRGTYLWDGAAGTFFWIDPTNDLIFVGMIQRRGGPDVPQVQLLSRPLTFQALLEPQK
jgi:CubicO group peptidase (beta-lactamase class C family)